MSGGRCALLLRAVNVGGTGRVPMAELRALLTERMDLGTVATYIASGNVICDAPEDRDAACTQVRALIQEGFGVDTPVILRTHDELERALAENPFPDAASDRMLHVMFLEADPQDGAVEALTGRLLPEERIALRGRDLWIDYAAGVNATRLTRPVFDRALGVAGTARNLRTVRKLAGITAD
ncbi:DUF1697 domain-containing protein [Microbacterium capsulatum]|uniref:DUF1697 domain-containing protein n=1 Tax=Microbacterium capsulatum TaxID=3041921 RepID=A0ABU0XIK3_9MICO|nr:DUF1697 domain-containing protein [Microbacterium sp. ASV81]MDQ4214398.1 DUF1697 domain-containing protein [Microbacterium sp. ASV81]